MRRVTYHTQYLLWISAFSSMNLNRKHTRCITTLVHRRHSCLWGYNTRWMELPGSEEKSPSIPSCCPLKGHRGLLLEPNGTWCAFSLCCLRGCRIGRCFHDSRTTLLLISQPCMKLSPCDLTLRWFFFALVSCLCRVKFYLHRWGYVLPMFVC